MQLGDPTQAIVNQTSAPESIEEPELNTFGKTTEGLPENRYQCPLNCGRKVELKEAGLWQGRVRVLHARANTIRA